MRKCTRSRGVSLAIGQGEFVAIGPGERLGKVDVHERRRVPRPPDERVVRLSAASTSTHLDLDQLALLRRHYIGFVFQGFNLLAARPRSRTSSFRSSTGASPRREAARARA